MVSGGRWNIVAALAIAAIGGAGYLLPSRNARRVHAEENTKSGPEVRITAPAERSLHPWNSLVNYSIVVTDQGKSTQYDEIPSTQVVLTTNYVADLSESRSGSDHIEKDASAGLSAMAASNCIGCHEFKMAATGPSFAAISKRYGKSESAIETVSGYIREGSVGQWGSQRMPPHPDLSQQQLHAISSWILQYADDPDLNVYVGTQGTFRMTSPGKPAAGAGLLLTASYARPGPQPARAAATVVVLGSAAPAN